MIIQIMYKFLHGDTFITRELHVLGLYGFTRFWKQAIQGYSRTVIILRTRKNPVVNTVENCQNICKK